VEGAWLAFRPHHEGVGADEGTPSPPCAGAFDGTSVMGVARRFAPWLDHGWPVSSQAFFETVDGEQAVGGGGKSARGRCARSGLIGISQPAVAHQARIRGKPARRASC